MEKAPSDPQKRKIGPGLKLLFMLIAFAIGPGVGYLATTYLKKEMETLFTAVATLAKTIVQKEGVSVGTPYGSVKIDAPKDMVIPELASIDAFCESSGNDESMNQLLCEPYKEVSHARIAALAGLVATPLVPLLVSLALVINGGEKKEKSAVQKGAAWTVLKIANKIIGLKSAAFAFAATIAVAFLGLSGILGWIVGLLIFSLLYGIEMAAVEAYTDSKMTIEPEFEPEPPKVAS